MRVLLDACVLYPTVPRDLLLGCAGAGLLEPLWSPRILEEWRRAVLRRHPEQAALVAGEIAALRAAHPAAEHVAPAEMLDRLALPDPDDVHVLAAAIAGGAQALVTFNIADFPGRALARHAVVPRHPDGLLLELLAEAPGPVNLVIERVLAPLAAMGPRRAILKRARLPRLGKAVG